MRPSWAPLGLPLLLALAVPASAAPGTISVRAELPLEVRGQHEASGTDARFLLQGPEGTAAFLLQGRSGQAERVVHRMWGYVDPREPHLGLVWDDDIERVPLALDGAVLSLQQRLAGFSLLAYDGDLSLATGPQRTPLFVGALDAPKTVEHSVDRAFLIRLARADAGEGRFQQVLPAGTLQGHARDGHVVADGALRLFVSDAVVSYAGPSGVQQVLAHFREELRPGVVYDPVSRTWSGPGEHTEYVQEHLVVDAANAHLDLLFTGVTGALYAGAAVLDLEGTALLPSATGTVTVTEDGKTERHALRGDDLEVGGRLLLRASDVVSTPARAQVDGEGDLTAVTYSGVAATYDWASAAAAAGLGALALAALGWVAFNAKALGPAAASLVAGYARVSGQEVLEHPGRQEVYERVKASPGISFAQLAEQVGFGQSTLNYHLRVLEKNEYVAQVKDGRYLRFFDRQGGAYSGHRKHAVSALRNETTAAMARHIRANPGIVQRDLAAAFGVTASTVSWHITRLANAGLVTRTRDAHFTRYFLADGWSQLPAEETERQMVAPVLVA